MSRRYQALTLAAVLLVSVGCSSGPSLDEYFNQLVSVRKQLDETGKKLQEESSAKMQEATSDLVQLQVFRAYLAKTVDAANVTVSQLKDLDPPDEAKDAHEAFVAAYEDTVTAMQEGMAASANATTLDDAFTALTSGDVVTASKDLSDACDALQKVADDNGVDADLQCQSPDAGGEGGSAPPP